MAYRNFIAPVVLSFLGSVLVPVAFARQADVPTTQEPMASVDPFIGTDRGGIVPGAALPFSLVRLSPDTLKPSTAGYKSKEPIVGFSHTHMSGAGGIGYYGNIRVMPQTGPINVTDFASPKKDEKAEPGYYAVTLTRSDVRTELTLTPRAGVHRYTFPAGQTQRVLIDVAATLNTQRSGKPSSICTGAQARFISDREIEGQASFESDFANFPHTVFFVARFATPVAARGAWRDAQVFPGQGDIKSERGQDSGLYAEFPAATKTPLDLRIGISFSSLANARVHLAPAEGKSFDQVKVNAQAQWKKHLDTIQVEGGTPAQRRQFYTALYHTVLMPTEVTGDADWKGTEPHFQDIHAVWDTFRATYPLFTLIQRTKQEEIVRCLLDIYKQKGWLPDYWRGGRYNIVQGGTNADVVIADAFVKNLKGFDRNLAYEGVLKNATVPTKEKKYPQFGRHEPYFRLGYVAAEPGFPANGFNSPVSTTLEYAYNDFAVATVAEATGHVAEAAKYRERSRSAFKLFHPETRFFWAKDEAGNWLPGFDPVSEKRPWTSPYYEGNAWHYRFYAPQDVQGLIDRFGGDAAFLSALDEYFDGKHDNHGNEPSFLTPWLHVYAGRPDKNVDRVREIMAKDYQPTTTGYAGDDDSGSMSAWYVFGALGFFPVAGQDVYLLASPIFTRSTLNTGDGKTFTVIANRLSEQNRYVQKATLNGKVWDQAWLRHGDIVSGGKLVLEMGPKPSSSWGIRMPPPSLTPRKDAR